MLNIMLDLLDYATTTKNEIDGTLPKSAKTVKNAVCSYLGLGGWIAHTLAEVNILVMTDLPY